jgi:hypothetical protein
MDEEILDPDGWQYPSCLFCRFYRKLEDGRKYGFCHRYPPTDGQVKLSVPHNEWCGEFSRGEFRS